MVTDGQCQIGVFDGVSIVESVAVVLMEGLGGDVFAGGPCAIQW